jgi:beta-lactamase superfamily II metal-dependent hydrolase
MADDIQVRTVRVEFLRAGPAHNQLLSPLTPYLAVCDDAEAGVVQVPFEQNTFERRMRAMRHQDQSDHRGERPADRDRLPSLRELGIAMARLLGSVPRFPGSLAADPNGRDTIVRVSLTLTAAELAALPFELAKVPIGPDATTESWLCVQSKVPVVITRRTRNVSNTRMTWLESPRVLFIAAGDGHGEVPFEDHLRALTDAVRPFAHGPRFGQKARLQVLPDKDGLNVRRTFGDLLTVLSNATLDGVVRECRAQRYTHVHILGHGGRDGELGDNTYGLLLHPDDGVISGDRLASALTGMVDGQLHRPQVVTLATCDSANASDVVNPGASLAHALHQAGIPLVVASQVPLGFQGSVLFAQTFYDGLLWGEHPWVLMHRVRTTLHSRLKPAEHDWASLVVYEALPSDMVDALERAAYQQCRRALDVAYASGRWVGNEVLDKALDRLCDTGRTYAMEARALRADARMINARDDAFDIALNPGQQTEAELQASFHFRRWCLQEALHDYTAAVVGFLVSAGQGLQAPYRQLVAKFSIQLVLGKPADWGDWHTARIWAETVLAHPDSTAEDQGWAHACLAELWLLRQLEAAAPPADECLNIATAAMRQAVQMRQPRDGYTESPTYWLEYRLFGYLDAWSQPQLREGYGVQTEDTSGTPIPLDLAPLVAGARRLLKRMNRLDSQLGLREQPDTAPAPPRPRARGPADDGPQAAGAEPPEAAGAGPDTAPAISPMVPMSYQAAIPRVAEAVAAAPSLAAQAAQAAVAQAASHTAALLQSRPGRRPSATGKTATGKTAKGKTPKGKPAQDPPASPPATGPAVPADPVFNLELLPVAQGDGLLLEWGSRSGPRWRLLIDGGTEASFKRALGPRLQALPPDQRHLELFILSHIDGDHIGGGIALLQQAKALGVTFGDIWFNGRDHLVRRNMLSGKDGDDFTTLLKREKLPWNRWRAGKAIVRDDAAGRQPPTVTLAGGLTLTLLSPTPRTLEQLADTWDEDLARPGRRRLLSGRQLERETDFDTLAARRFSPDGSRPNGSSIAVLAEFAGKRLLLAADAYADVLADAVRRLLPPGQARLPLDAFKLSHHGSRGNVDDALLALLDCPRYLVSTSGAVFDHPDREALARVVRRSAQPPTLWFNYPTPAKNGSYHALWRDPAVQQRWGFQVREPEPGREGVVLSLFDAPAPRPPEGRPASPPAPSRQPDHAAASR